MGGLGGDTVRGRATRSSTMPRWHKKRAGVYHIRLVELLKSYRSDLTLY